MKKIFFILLLIPFLGFSQVVNTLPSYNVTQYGLKGDSSTDNTTAFRNLLASIPDGSRVYFPKGDYIFSDSILINKSIELFGAGKSGYSFYTIVQTPVKGSSNLLFTSATKNFLVFNVSSTNAGPIINCHDISIINKASTQPSAGAGILLNGNLGHADFNRVAIDSFWVNFYIYSAYFVKMYQCDIVAPSSVGIIIDNKGAVDEGGTDIGSCNIISGLDSLTPQPMGIYMAGGGGIHIHENFFNAQGVYNLPTQFKYSIYADFKTGATSDIHIVNNFFENYRTHAIKFLDSAGQALYNLNISLNECSPFNLAAAVDYAIYIQSWTNVQLIGNYGNSFQASPAAGTKPFIFLSNVHQVYVLPGHQNGWSSYDSTDSGTDGFGNFMTNPLTGNTASGVNFTIVDTSNSSTASAGITYKVGSTPQVAFQYITPSTYGFGLASSFINQYPLGDFVWYTGVQRMTLKNAGDLLLGTTTDNGLLTVAGKIMPEASGTRDIGSSSFKFQNLYSTGIVGTTTNNNASAGNVGEYVHSHIAVGSAVTLSTTTAANVTSISLTAGDWDVEGIVNFQESGGTTVARQAGITTTSATIPSDGSEGYNYVNTVTLNETNSITIPSVRMSLSGTTTVYLVGTATFSAGTMVAFGNITARRVR